MNENKTHSNHIFEYKMEHVYIRKAYVCILSLYGLDLHLSIIWDANNS